MKFRTVILAAGKGTRMGSDKPKVLLPIANKPILQHLIESIRESGVDGTPVVVVSPDGGGVCETFGETCHYAIQEEPLGTGHAVMCAREAAGDSDAVIVLYGDHPFVSPEALRRLTKIHADRQTVLTMMTTVVPSFDGWYGLFLHWGRVLRDAHGHIMGIREYKDAMESERQIREVNEPFDVPGIGKCPATQLMFPRDPNGPACQIINCGCQSLPYKEDWGLEKLAA